MEQQSGSNTQRSNTQRSNTQRSNTQRSNTRYITTIGMLAAIGIVLVAFIEVPIFPSAAFLKYDPADIPILIGTIIYGPLSGLILTVIISFIQSFFLHGSGGPIGFVMHVVATGAMSLVLGILYHRSKKNLKSAALSLSAGAIAMTLAMAGMNLWLTPIFMGVPLEKVLPMMLPVIIPFNIIKAGINCIVTFLLYRYVERIIKR